MSENKISFEMPNAKELQKILQSLPNEVSSKGLKDAVYAAAAMMRDRIRDNLRAVGAVRTGRLLKGIVARRASSRDKDFVSAKAGPYKVPYAHLIELGHWHPENKTKWIPARPFVAPAFVASEKDINAIVCGKITAICKEALPGGQEKNGGKGAKV